MATYISGLGPTSICVGPQIQGAQLNAVGGIVQTPTLTQAQRTITFTLGTSTTGSVAGVCDTFHQSVRSINTSGSDTLTLSALVGTSTNLGTTTAMYDICGQSAPVFARVRAVMIELLSATLTPLDVVGPLDPAPTACSQINVGNAASHAWVQLVNSTGTFPLFAGDSYMKVSRAVAGWPVVLNTTDQLKIANADGANAATYRIVLMGCST